MLPPLPALTWKLMLSHLNHGANKLEDDIMDFQEQPTVGAIETPTFATTLSSYRKCTPSYFKESPFTTEIKIPFVPYFFLFCLTPTTRLVEAIEAKEQTKPLLPLLNRTSSIATIVTCPKLGPSTTCSLMCPTYPKVQRVSKTNCNTRTHLWHLENTS